ncbi:NAD-dependent epimerase/dehydratase family protein [Smaragdicoccus niigatensis]|uniref:NAD-dependent epimerase/dehydratase family protein n=1 Tax=Smaragdicoccus niigatensis TaxID=359359 RepID=UPI00058BCF61|nr:NAD-dependent epimerase/dehydratase family protein [Smaragdicoccus niigatensis]
MKVFVTGATGAVGPYAVRALIDAGHEVTALARTDEKAALAKQFGANPARVSLFDAEELTTAFAGHDAVVNLATSIPSLAMFPFTFAWRANSRIRVEGSAAVTKAALAAGVPRLVQESICMVYPDSGDAWITESAPLDLVPIVTSTPVAEGNAQQFTNSGGTGVVLRFGLFYGPGSVQSAQMMGLARLHFGIVLGPAKRYMSLIHLEDAGQAVVAALAAPAGIYNVACEPVTKRGFGDAISDAVGKKQWVRGPGRLASLGGRNMNLVLRSLRVSSDKFSRATGWAPKYPTVREGWAATASTG